MSWQNERPENPYAYEREEARDAQRHATGQCYRHHWVSDGRGGGVCTGCGDTIGAEEL